MALDAAFKLSYVTSTAEISLSSHSTLSACLSDVYVCLFFFLAI